MHVRINTSYGPIVAELNREQAPISVENFLTYADAGAYDGTIFHRVIDGFVVQGGGFEPDFEKRPTRAPIKNESQNDLKNTAGTLAMARTQEPDSATNQFFINLSDNSFLDTARPETGGAAYTVFGRVEDGMDVVRRIASVPTSTQRGMQDVPVEPVLIESVERIPADETSGGGGEG